MSKVDELAAALAADFHELPESARLELLLEFADSLPELPLRYADHPELLERVEECQSPVYLFVELNENSIVQVFLTAPVEAPTTRGFASILHSVVNQQPAIDVLNLDDDFPGSIGLTALISPLRINGMRGMMRRIKRQVSERIAANQ
jgi:cysteine desulfuration protein SufE